MTERRGGMETSQLVTYVISTQTKKHHDCYALQWFPYIKINILQPRMSLLHVRRFALCVLLHDWIELLIFLAVRLSHASKRIFYIENISEAGRANNFTSAEALHTQRAVTTHCDDLVLLREESEQLRHLTVSRSRHSLGARIWMLLWRPC